MSDESGVLPKTSPTPTVVGAGEEIIYVEFEDADRRNPQNYSRLRKWIITLIACYFSAITAAASSSFSISTPSMTQELHCTELEATLGLSLYAIGFGVVPLVASSFSEEVGRRPVYIFSSIMYTLSHVMVALSPNIGTVLAGRTLGGVFGSTGASLAGGSVADIWKPEERGFPMTLCVFSALFSVGLGSAIGGVIQSNPHLGWRWVQWIHVIFSGVFAVAVYLEMSETRSSIILIQMAQTKRKLTGDSKYKAKAEINKESLLSLIKTSRSRPLYFLLTEPIVQSFSLWCGFLWGVVFCLLVAVSPIFKTVYGFNIQQTGYVYTALSIGAIIGSFGNLYQDKLYMINYPCKKQEARLYLPCVAAICLPVGMFIVAWTASPRIHWIVPLIGLTLFMTGVMVIFQAAFLYLADCYNIYASSAQAGQNLFRNIMAFAFPLFTQKMFANLTYEWALTLFGFLAVIMAPTLFVMYVFGSKIRARSFASRQILAEDAQASLSSDSASGLETVNS